MEVYKVLREEDKIYPMGLTIMDNKIHISVDNEAKECSLVLYEKGQTVPCLTIPMSSEERIGNVWNLTIEGLVIEDLEYCFEVDGSLMADPYGKSFRGWEQWGDLGNASVALRCPMKSDGFQWEGDRPLHLPFEEMIIYRIHTRGFTKHTSSKVTDKGTFKAIIDKIPYMKELGITTVELLPITEFQEVMMPGGVDKNPYAANEPTGKINYWGYAGGYYCAPKASFSSGKQKQPVQEFKTLVKELHKAGIEIIIELYFDGSQSQTFMLDVVRFWVQEYHLDGIHLVGNVPTGLLGEDPYLKKTKLFATSWDGVDGGKQKHLAEYNDGFMVDMRRALKGDEEQMKHLIFRSSQNPEKSGVINYMANTNGFTMMDMVSYDIKHNEANGENNQDGSDYNFSWNCGVEGPTRRKKIVGLRKKQIRNALVLLFLSQGTPLLLSGDEFGKSKSGNNNSYCQDNEISWLNWNQKKTNQDIYEFVKGMIAFRKKHPVFHMEKAPRLMDYLACGHPDVSYHGVKAWCPEFENFRRQIGVMYSGEYGKHADGTSDNYFYVAYNMHWNFHEFGLPNLPKTMKWHLAINTDECEINGIYLEGEEPMLEDQKNYRIPARSIVVLIGKHMSANKKKQR